MEKLTLESDKTVALPFGIYNVTSASYNVSPKAILKVVPLTTSFEISNSSSSTVTVALGVAGSFTIDIRRADGSPLLGAELEFLYSEGGNVTFFKGVVQGPVKLINLPYGRYFVRVSWKSVQILQTSVTVSRDTRNTTLYTSIIPGVILTVIDADGQPLPNYQLRVEGPAMNTTFISDAQGRVVLPNVIPSLYTIRVDWMGTVIARQAYISANDVTVELPLRKVAIRLTASTRCPQACSLPPNLLIEVLYGNKVLAEHRTLQPTNSVELETSDYIFTSVQLVLNIYWNNSLLIRKNFNPTDRVFNLEIPFFDVSVTIRDAKGNPLPGALIVASDSLGSRMYAADTYGFAYVRFLYGGSAHIEVRWFNITVSKISVDPSVGSLAINSYVFPLVVEVTGTFKPIGGAVVTVQVSGLGYSFNASGVTDEDGKVELKLPFPPDATAKLYIVKGRIKAERTLTVEELKAPGPLRLKLDVLVDAGWIQLTIEEAVLIVAIVVIASVAGMLVTRYIRLRHMTKSIFEIYGSGVEEEEVKAVEGVLEKLKRIFGAEGHAEEEEEEGLFEEL